MKNTFPVHDREELIDILKNDVPEYADIEINGSSIIEVWYDDSTNTVILK